MKKMFSLPHKYATRNLLQRQHAKEVIDKFKNKLKWDAKPNSSLIDVGCGTGDVTIDYVEPLLSNNYKSIVGVDISEETINFAQKSYEGKYPRVKFEVMDIADKALKIQDEFDHVTSFYCLHLVQDQRQAFKNIHTMLKSNGDILLLLVAKIHIFWILHLLETNPRFKPHMTEVATYASPYRYSETPAEDLAEVLKEAGFKDINCNAIISDVILEKHQIENIISMANFLKAGTSEDIRKEFIKGFISLTKELELVEEDSGKTTYRFPCNNLVAYAKK